MHIFRLTSIALGITIALTGCMVGPDFHAPSAPKTKTYTIGTQPQKTVGIAQAETVDKAQYFLAERDIPADWWQMFHSPELNELVQKGLTNSPNLAAAQAALLATQEAVTAQVGTSLFPAVTTSLGAQRQRFLQSSFGSTNTGNIFNLYNASVGVSYTLDMFGGAQRQIEALRDQVDYQRFQVEAANLTLTSNIVTTAVTVASLQAQIQATQELIQLQEKQFFIVKKQFNLGAASNADVFTQQSQVAQAHALLFPLEQNLAQANHALSVLVGELPSESRIPKFNLTSFNLPAKLPLSVPSLLVKQRPDVRAAEALLAAASAQVGVATANLYPKLTLSGNYGWQNNHPADLLSVQNNVWSLGGNLLQPIFNGGSLRAKKKGAEATYQQTLAQYKQVVLQAFQNVADVLRALQHDAETFKAQKEAESAAYRSLLLTQKQYHLGGMSYLSLLMVEKQYQQARIGRIQAQAARYADTAALFQALGGGWWNRKS